MKYNILSGEKPKENRNAVQGANRQLTAIDELNEGPAGTTTLVCRSYGGVTVNGANTATEAALKLLDFAVAHRRTLDALLTQYGILVEVLDEFPLGGFCIRRTTDGWALLVPEATVREHALLQIVQAFLAIARTPLAQTLRDAGIHPYRD
jgi:hypothetical protein